jgi:hypothetical protein
MVLVRWVNRIWVARRTLEITEMPTTRKDGNGNHGYAAPVAWIVLLLCGYWVISEWHSLPTLIGSAIATIK